MMYTSFRTLAVTTCTNIIYDSVFNRVYVEIITKNISYNIRYFHVSAHNNHYSGNITETSGIERLCTTGSLRVTKTYRTKSCRDQKHEHGENTVIVEGEMPDYVYLQD